MLASPATGHGFQSVSRRLFQVVQVNRRDHRMQLAKGHVGNAGPSPVYTSLRQLRRVAIPETYDHTLSVQRCVWNAKLIVR